MTHFFVSLMYARPEELGYDPTITPARDPKARANNQYDIVVRDVEGTSWMYRTTRLISSIGAESLRGRGTRVWEAQRLINGRPQGKSVALKDSWIDDHRDREAAILEKIIASASSVKDRETLVRHLLTIMCYGDVYVNGAKDSTKQLRRGLVTTSDIGSYALRQPTPLAPDGTLSEDLRGVPVGTSLYPAIDDVRPQLVMYNDKTHHRIVFNEVGTPIETLTSLSSIVRMLLLTLRGKLLLLFVFWL